MTRQIHTKLLQYATENWKAAKQLNKTATHVSRDDKQKFENAVSVVDVKHLRNKGFTIIQLPLDSFTHDLRNATLISMKACKLDILFLDRYH